MSQCGVLVRRWHGVCSSSTEPSKNARCESPTYLLNFRRTTMTTLMIKDLTLTEQLDRKAMAAVHGGMLKAYVPYWVPGYSESTSSFEASQVIGQVQNIVNQNGNN